MIFADKQMLKELILEELTIGKKNTSSERIHRISNGRLEVAGGKKRKMVKMRVI